MTTAVQDSQTPRCLTCDYPLMSLSEHRCPECGRAFDPADARTVRTPRSPGKIARFLLKPPGWPSHIAIGLTVAISLFSLSAPGGYFGLMMLAFFSWIVVAISWWSRGFIYSVLRRKFKKDWHFSNRTSVRWLVMPLAVVFTYAMLAIRAPAYVAFWLSRSSMDALAKEVINDTNPSASPRWVGVYYAQDVEKTPTGMRFLVSGTGFLDREGFAWSMTPLPANDSHRYAHFNGPWYTWQEEW